MSSEIKKHLSTLYDWLAIEDNPQKSDLIFLFGGSVINIAQKGLQLLEKGYSPLIITTGCTGTFGNPEWKKPIADIFADFLIKNGVAKKKVLVQNRSMNTPEDVVYSLPILEKNKIKLKSIILVSRPVHQRRAFATFVKQFPYKLKIINQPCDEVHPSLIKDDKKLIEIGTRCVQEYERLIKYAKKGDTEKQEIPDKVHLAASKLNEFLSRQSEK